jgi:quinol-cytochrome oxidoreductase complex cytochrome b subunit
MVAKKEKTKRRTLRSRPFWPGFALEELSILLLLFGLILMLASLLHPSQIFESGLGEAELQRLESPADPFNTPPQILPEWYFLAVFELLKLMDAWIVTLLIGLFAAGFFIVPFAQRFLSKYKFEDWALRLSVVAIVIIFLYFTAMGMGLVD